MSHTSPASLSWVMHNHNQLVGRKCRNCERAYPCDDNLLQRSLFVASHKLFPEDGEDEDEDDDSDGTEVHSPNYVPASPVDDDNTVADEAAADVREADVREAVGAEGDTVDAFATDISADISCDICYNTRHPNSFYMNAPCACHIKMCLACSMLIQKCPMCRQALRNNLIGADVTLSIAPTDMDDEQLANPLRHPDDDESSSSSDTVYHDDEDDNDNDEASSDDDSSESVVVFELNNRSIEHSVMPFLMPRIESVSAQIARFSLSSEVVREHLRANLISTLSYSMSYEWIRTAYGSMSTLYTWPDAQSDAQGNYLLCVPHVILTSLFQTLICGIRALLTLNKVNRHTGIIKVARAICMSLRRTQRLEDMGFAAKLNWMEENDIVNVAINVIRKSKRHSTSYERLLISWS